VEVNTSTPNFFAFNPTVIPSQARLIFDMETVYDYGLGSHDVLLSGSVGSSKSLVGSHVIIKHCLLFPGARVIIGRKALPDIKKTIFQTLIEHLDGDERLKEGKHWFARETTADIWFANKSEIIPVYWNDKSWTRIRSINASAAFVEELTENDDTFKKAFFEIKQRVGRLSHVPHKWLLAATNPASPRHWAYKYFIEPIQKGKPFPTRHVIYSKTKDNPFLPPSYIQNLRESLDPKEARRQLDGEWVEIDTERVYHSYSEKNFKAAKYQPLPEHPISICFDFNIGEGKPMSSALYQKVGDTFHVFAECIIHGSRTLDIMEEWFDRGVFDYKCPYWSIKGDATGGSRNTRSVQSDYDIIEKFLSNKNIKFKNEVPQSNPPLKTRHNRMNAYFLNDLGQHRMFVWGCDKVDEGFRLTALKSGGQYVEDDSKDYQHVTSCIGYGLVYDTESSKSKISSQRMR
jgi:Phage terminase large subunit